MLKYALNPDPKRSVKVYGRGLRISRKDSTLLCREISGKPLMKAKSLLEGLLGGSRDLDGKTYNNATAAILDVLKSAESNAEAKGMEAGGMLVNASAHQGFRFFRPRRFKNRRQKRKVTNVQVVLTVG